MDVETNDTLLLNYRDSVTKIERAVRRATSGGAGMDRAEELYLQLENQIVEAARIRSAQRTRIEADIQQRESDSFACIDIALELVLTSFRILDECNEKPPPNVHYVFSGLLVRTIQVFNEIGALMRAGYGVGARSRWRTLSEIRTVAGVLALGGEREALRYKEHRGYLVARDSLKLYGSADWDGPGRSAQTFINALSRRFGESFCTNYGWAAGLTRRRLGVKRPSWRDVERLIEVSEHKERVLLAHHAVHGDSVGLLQLVDASGTFNAGPSAIDVRATLADATYLFRQSINALLDLWRTHVETPRVQAIQLLLDESLLSVTNELLFVYQTRGPDEQAT